MKSTVSSLVRQYRPWLSSRYAVTRSIRQDPLPARPFAPANIQAASVGQLRYHSVGQQSERSASEAADEEPARPLTDRIGSTTAKDKAENAARQKEEPSYQLTFTCAKCLNRSSHRISKQGYHNGTVLVNCPGCKNKHLISDHLGIFSDKSITLEDIMKQKGEKLKRGSLSQDGDIEFY